MEGAGRLTSMERMIAKAKQMTSGPQRSHSLSINKQKSASKECEHQGDSLGRKKVIFIAWTYRRSSLLPPCFGG